MPTDRAEGVDARLVVEQLYLCHAVAVRRHLGRLGARPEDVEDLCQETFIRALIAFKRLGAMHSPRSFLLHVANQVLIDQRRKEHARQRLQSRLASEPYRGVGVDDETASLASLLGPLGPQDRFIVTLRTILDRPYEDIARALGRTASWVRLRHFRSLRTLRRHLRRSAEGGDTNSVRH